MFVAFCLVIPAAGLALASPVSADEGAAGRCSAFHKFGAEPVDVAKTADGGTVVAQAVWQWHDSIGCYLVLADAAVTALRAAGPPASLPQGQTNASRTCSAHHKFGAEPVDVAKTADGQEVLARLSWGRHSSIGCYLVLNDTAVTSLRTRLDNQPTPADSDGATTGERGFVGVSVGQDFSCGLRAEGAIVCWGQNGFGRAEAPPGSFRALSAGITHACALRTDDTIACWGDNDDGQTDAPAGAFSTLEAGEHHSCAVRASGAVVCWGENRSGETNVPGGSFSAVSAGAAHSCGLRTNGTVACWGYNLYGESDPPPGTFLAVSAGYNNSCALRSGGAVVCWGRAREGVNDPPSGSFTDVKVGNRRFACGLRPSGAVACWGRNIDGRTSPPGGKFTAIALGDHHACGLRSDGAITCWGSHDDGRSAPPGSPDAVSAAFKQGSQQDHSCQPPANGIIRCAEFDSQGLVIYEDGRYKAIADGFNTYCGVRADGTMYCSGNEPYNPLREEYTTELPAGTFIDVVHSNVTDEVYCGLRTNSTVACWDRRKDQKDLEDWRIPTPTGTFTQMSAKWGTYCGLRTDGTVECWGFMRDDLNGPPSGTFVKLTGVPYGFCGLRTNGDIDCWQEVDVRDKYKISLPPGTYQALVGACGLRRDGAILCGYDPFYREEDAPSGTFSALAIGMAFQPNDLCGLRSDGAIICWGTRGSSVRSVRY